MRTQLTDLKKELTDIERSLQLNLMYNNLPKETVIGLLKRQEMVRSIIYNIM